MTREQNPLRLNFFIQEFQRLKLERSFEHAEQYLENTLAENPNNRDALAALAVLLLEGGQYSKANAITQQLSKLITNGDTTEDQFGNQDKFEQQLQDDDAEDDISADLALSRQMAEMEGFHLRIAETLSEPESQVGKDKPSEPDRNEPWRNQAEIRREPSLLSSEKRGSTETIAPKALDVEFDQRMHLPDDRILVSSGSSNTFVHHARTFVPNIDQSELDLDDLMPISRKNENDQDPYRQGFDIDSIADGIPDDDAGVDDTDWSDDLPQVEQDFQEERDSANAPELDEGYAEDAFSESPTPEELTSIPDAKSTRERAEEVALELMYEYGLEEEYRPVLTKIFLKYWWSRCKTSIREQLDLAVSAKALDMARQVREHWAESPEYHEYISHHQRYDGYVSLPWRLAIRLIDAYRQYPQFEEIVGFLGLWFDEWDTRIKLQRKFPSFYSMIRYIVERSESDSVDPSAVLDLLREVEN